MSEWILFLVVCGVIVGYFMLLTVADENDKRLKEIHNEVTKRIDLLCASLVDDFNEDSLKAGWRQIERDLIREYGERDVAKYLDRYHKHE